jgi:heme oxygenase
MILRLLKERTRPLHDRVERSVDITSRLGDRESYQRLLARLLGFYELIEKPLIATLGPEMAERQKAPWLRRDLTALGMTDREMAALPRCSSLPRVDGEAAALGCAYVLEGATLGGQFVRRHVESRLGLAPDQGVAFYTSYGERVGEMWKQFGLRLDDHATRHPDSHELIIDRAIATFLAFERWLAEEPR